MTLIRDTISNFIGGVSEQPDKVMFPNQAKKLENYLLSISDGLKKRPPLRHIKKILEPLSQHPQTHTIIKENEKYEVIFTGDNIKVFDLDGNEKDLHFGDKIYEVVHGETLCYTDKEGEAEASVEADTQLYSDYYLKTPYQYESGEVVTDFVYNGVDEPEGLKADLLEYVTSTKPLLDLDATTIGDYTFVLNQTKTVELEDETYPNPHAYSALLFVRQGDYTTDYKIYIDGVEKASHTTSDQPASTKTNAIADTLKNQLTSNLGSGWSVTGKNSCILIHKNDNTEFSITATDSNADYNLYAFYKETNNLQTLPTVAPNGFIIKIVGEQVAVEDDYYVQFKTTSGDDFGSGTWVECSAPNIKYKLKASTMPHALTRNEDGTFTFKTIEWTPRGAGNEDSAPSPSFIGQKIQEVFTYKGRLAFIASDKSCYSDTEDIFSFFKKTTQTELDTDPIDVASNSKMVELNHTLAFNESLLLFSPTTEFTVKGGDIFANGTVAIDLSMQYQCSSDCKPVNTGNTGLFVFENGEYSKLMELYVTSTYNLDAREVTEQVPSYLPKDIYKIAASTANNLVCLLSTQHRDTVYVYNYYYSSEQKAQSAWSQWKIINGQILNVDFKDNLLYFVVQYTDGVYLLDMDFSQNNKESGLDYLFYLDRKVYLTDLTYDAESNTTSFSLPYTPVNELIVLDALGFPHNYTQEEGIYTINGEYSQLIVGNIYSSNWILSNIYVREAGTNGGVKVREGLLMLRDINLTYSDTGYFRVAVTPKYTTQIASSFIFTGKISGTNSATLGKIPVSSGTFLIPIISKNEEINIEVINDSYLPSDFLSLEWLGDFSIRGQ